MSRQRHQIARGPIFAAAVAGCALFTSSADAALLVAEAFGGSASAALNGTAADTFDAAVIAAGGSGTWVARTGAVQFNADGSITTSGSTDGAAYLTLGSYVNDAKGDADGIFELQMTIGDVTAGNWLSIGFSGANPPAVNNNFTGNSGLATALLRGPEGLDNEVDYFAGLGSTNTPASGTNAGPGAHTIKIVLDLSGHNNSTNFGTVSYFIDGSSTAAWSYNYAADRSFNAILVTQDNGANGKLSALSLTQVPEPASLSVLGLGGLALLRRRRA